MALLGILQQRLVTCNECHAVLACGSDEYSVRGITVNFAGEAGGLDQDLYCKRQKLQSTIARSFFKESFYGHAELQISIGD